MSEKYIHCTHSHAVLDERSEFLSVLLLGKDEPVASGVRVAEERGHGGGVVPGLSLIHISEPTRPY